MWGQVSDTLTVTGAARIIPTRVGTSYIRHCINICNGDHPHACGDKGAFTAVGTASEGSSPRVWGQGIGNVIMDFPERIIPTRVGTRLDRMEKAFERGDHPHACGDKLSAQRPSLRSQGSSPRVWGQVDADFTVDLSDRIIPTRVGTSRAYDTRGRRKRDHPHACGDKVSFASSPVQTVGSSPRVWGQVGQVVSACIGMRDHPHACGDKTQIDYISMIELGSSPRVWGQANFVTAPVSRVRIIPTRVGTRGFCWSFRKERKDHPHACGDK